MVSHSINYLQSKNGVLIIPNLSQKIYFYSLSTKKCDLLPIEVSEKIYYPKTALTRDHEYVIQLSRKRIRTINVINFKIVFIMNNFLLML